MNDKYFRNIIEKSSLGSMGLDLLDAQQKLISQKYEIESLRIKGAMYKAYFFRNSELAEKLKNSGKKIQMLLQVNLMDSVMQVGEQMLCIEHLKICGAREY